MEKGKKVKKELFANVRTFIAEKNRWFQTPLRILSFNMAIFDLFRPSVSQCLSIKIEDRNKQWLEAEGHITKTRKSTFREIGPSSAISPLDPLGHVSVCRGT